MGLSFNLPTEATVLVILLFAFARTRVRQGNRPFTDPQKCAGCICIQHIRPGEVVPGVDLRLSRRSWQIESKARLARTLLNDKEPAWIFGTIDDLSSPRCFRRQIKTKEIDVRIDLSFIERSLYQVTRRICFRLRSQHQ